MRESIGTAGIFTIVMTFIVLFTAYLAVSVNYAKAFRIRNHVINMVEDNAGNIDDAGVENIRKYLTSQNYGARGKCPTYIKARIDQGSGTDSFKRVRAIRSDNDESDDAKNCLIGIYAPLNNSHNLTNGCDSNNPTKYPRKHYLVVDFFSMDLPVISTWTTFSVYGETKTITDYTGTCS